MRYRLMLIAFVLIFTTLVIPIEATVYRLAACYKDSIYLISEDGKYASKLVKNFSGSIEPELLMLSPDGKMLAAYAQIKDQRWLCRVDIETGTATPVRQLDDYYSTPDKPAWFGNSVLFSRYDEVKGDLGTYAIDIKTGEMKRVIPPSEGDDFSYGQILESPSGSLLAMWDGMTGATWFSLCDGITGKLIWPKKRDYDGVDGFTDICWSPDNKWLFVAFCLGDEDMPGPGGLWKYDAATGKKSVVKYKGENIWGVEISPDGKLLAAILDKRTDILSYPSLALVRSLEHNGCLNYYGKEGFFYFLGQDHYLFFDGDRSMERNGSTIMTHKYATKEFYKDVYIYPTISLSPEHDALLLGSKPDGFIDKTVSAILDLKSGKKIILPNGVKHVVWLAHPITR